MLMLHFFVEEPSAEALLIELVPRILQDKTGWEFEIYVFQGKQNLLKNLPARLRAFKDRLRRENARIIVLVDRDDDDCRLLKAKKAKMEKIAKDAGLTTKSQHGQQFQLVNRIAVEELEAWFFGDLDAIRRAYPKIKASEHTKAYRNPDAISGGTAEKLEELLRPYHPNRLEKIRAAREIAPHLQPDQNRSASFQAFRQALLELFS
jgi:hypothetical protein